MSPPLECWYVFDFCAMQVYRQRTQLLAAHPFYRDELEQRIPVVNEPPYEAAIWALPTADQSPPDLPLQARLYVIIPGRLARLVPALPSEPGLLRRVTLPGYRLVGQHGFNTLLSAALSYTSRFVPDYLAHRLLVQARQAYIGPGWTTQKLLIFERVAA